MAEEMLYWQALNRALDAEMEGDESVFVLGEDVGLYGGSYRVTEGLYAKYGESQAHAHRSRRTPPDSAFAIAAAVAIAGSTTSSSRWATQAPVAISRSIARCRSATTIRRRSQRTAAAPLLTVHFAHRRVP